MKGRAVSVGNKTWKQFERKAAAFFGTKRRACSGSYGHLDGKGRDDCMHEELFIECKHNKSLPVMRLYERTRDLADKESRIPVLALHEKGKEGFLIVVHCSDLQRVAESVQRYNYPTQTVPLIAVADIPPPKKGAVRPALKKHKAKRKS